MSTLPPNPTPEDFEKHFNFGFQAYQKGKLVEARDCFQQLLQYLPANSLLHYNLGLVQYELGDFNHAKNEFTLALTDDGNDTDTLFNLALSHAALGEHKDAIRLYKKILLEDPQNVDCLYNLAGCYKQLGQNENAIRCYQQVLSLDTTYVPAINNLAYLYHYSGDFQRAVPLYQQLLVARPDDENARFMLDALKGVHRHNAPDTYVRDTFDSYAKGFEQNLTAELGYNNPAELFDWVLETIGKEVYFTKGLDLGCGTGLSGVAFKSIIQNLHGVDLSGRMLMEANTKGIYDELHQERVDSFLQETANRYDLFIATDVFIYIGELEELFQAALKKAASSAYFCFSTEKLHEADGFSLMPTGRFAHSSSYIRETATNAGWTVIGSQKCNLRKERESWLAGELWLLKYSAA